jgi:tetrapyrrole methylase family protein/MazG family protein
MKSFDQLVRVMARLRSPGGCPWDRKQTHRSLLKFLEEEAQEVKAAVRKGDWDNLEEELGDLLLQVLFHSRIAEENGQFSVQDVVKTLIRKLTLRHPHVFGYKKEHRALLKGKSMKTAQDIVDNWDLLKKISVTNRRKR